MRCIAPGYSNDDNQTRSSLHARATFQVQLYNGNTGTATDMKFITPESKLHRKPVTGFTLEMSGVM
jgi:hypothetical protein